MPSGTASIARQRKTLKRYITSLRTALERDKVDATNAKLRVKRVTELFNAYEELHDELSSSDENNEGFEQMDQIRNNFYDIASRIENMQVRDTPRPSDTITNDPLGNSTTNDKQRQLKLPVAELSKFDGDHDKWLSFKNTFLSMVDARTDISDLSKFLYLKTSLTGAALGKIACYDASAQNYKNAWNLLIDSYEKRRILVSKHYDAIIDMPQLTTATPEGLSKLIDEVRQHMNMLESLQVKPDHGIILRLLERSLPLDVRQKWEESLSLDTLANLDQLYKFVNETVFRLCSLERDKTREGEAIREKRRAERGSYPSKARKVDSGARSFVTNVSLMCTHCQGNHLIYKCPNFEGLNIKQRWNVVKSKRLCRNCLRTHSGVCKSIRCKRCGRFHHTLLHSNVPAQGTSHSQPADKGVSQTTPEAKTSQ